MNTVIQMLDRIKEDKEAKETLDSSVNTKYDFEKALTRYYQNKKRLKKEQENNNARTLKKYRISNESK